MRNADQTPPSAVRKACALAIGVTLIAAVALAWFVLRPGDDAQTVPTPTPNAPRAALVALGRAEEREIVDTVEAIGTARANESVTITAKVTETVRGVRFEDGGYVDAGEVLVELTNAEETALLAEARAALDDAERQLTRLDGLVAQGSAPVSQRDEAFARRQGARARLGAVEARLGDRLIRAPFGGVLGFRRVSPGTLVTPNMEITTIDDIERIKLDFSVPETALASIRPDLDVRAIAAAWPERAFEGRVTTVDSRVDPVTRAITVRALLDNPERLLRPGMLLTVELVTARERALVVPESALLQIRDERFVYTVVDGAAQRVDVVIGRRRPGIVEIRAGLAQGTPVVTEGVDRVRPGVPVRIPEEAPARANAQERRR
jgi:membrane fusion protein (multidrug efflux system)